MHPPDKIPRPKILSRDDIDSVWWDARIAGSALPLPYAFTWYLDLICPGWMACVSADERWLMPLPVNRKTGGFRQVYQPYMTQQLGIFGERAPDVEDVNAMVGMVHRRFIRVRLHLNESNPLPSLAGPVCRPRTNMLLPLQRSYAEIRAGYHRSQRRNLDKTGDSLEYRNDPFTPEEMIAFYRSQVGDKMGTPHFPWERVVAMMRAATEREAGFLRGVADRQGRWLAAGFFLHSGGRIINLAGASTEEGRRHSAMHFLLDRVIHEWHGNAEVFDFEGSSIPGVAEFFRGFGARETSFPALHGGWLG